MHPEKISPQYFEYVLLHSTLVILINFRLPLLYFYLFRFPLRNTHRPEQNFQCFSFATVLNKSWNGSPFSEISTNWPKSITSSRNLYAFYVCFFSHTLDLSLCIRTPQGPQSTFFTVFHKQIILYLSLNAWVVC